ncbi:MAG: ATP-dependent zinc metalloprotease FtsH [bacterium]|nr:ATP-dependent zinc metalloprotease FtsH [bacterium]
MKFLIKNIIIVVIVFIVISGAFTIFYPSLTQQKQIDLTELVKNINRGEVKKITAYGSDLSVELGDGTVIESRKESETGLRETLSAYGAATEELNKIDFALNPEKEGVSSWLLPLLIFGIAPLILFGIFFWFIFRQAKAGATQAFSFTQARARLFGAEGHPKTKITFKDVAGLKEAKEELEEIVDFLRNPDKYLKMGAQIPRGVLLMGSAGTGKTLLSRAVAGEAGVPFFHISGSEFVEMFVGVGAGRVRDLFNTAKKAAPAIIFIDELDAIGRHRGAGLGGGHDEREQTLNQILVEMDGFERDTNVIVLAATNRPDILDPALLRPGRFDRKVVLDMPDVDGREDILRIHCKGKPLAEDVKLREIAERTPGFSGADVANVVNEAALLAARRDKTQVFQTEILESIDKVLLGPERKSHVLSKKEKKIAAFHEAGHALVSASLPGTEPIRKISIISRGMAAGYTLKMPVEDRRMRNKSEFLAELATLLGGYCAEKIVFGEMTTGASNDLKKASELARALVKEYGMSSLGPIAFGEKEELVFLGKEIGEERNYSEKVAARIDEELEQFIRNAELQAEKVLNKRRKMLDKIAEVLIKEETIEREEFEKIMKDDSIEKPEIRKDAFLKFKTKDVE